MKYVVPFHLKSIQTKLFCTYSLLIVSVFMIAAITFYIFMARQISLNASETIYQSANNISVGLDALLQEMDNTVVKIIFSDNIKKLFFNEPDPTSEISMFANQRELNSHIFSIMGPLQSDWQINIMNMKGRIWGTGDYSINTFLPLYKMEALDWIRSTNELDGRKWISTPRKDDWFPGDRTVISVSRRFPWDLGSSRYAIVEVQTDYQRLTAAINKRITPSSGVSETRSYMVFDRNGTLVYPLGADSTAAKLYWSRVQANATPSGKLELMRAGGNEIVSFTRSDYTGWTVAVSQSERVLLVPLVRFRNQMLIGAFGLLIVTLLVSFYVAKSLTAPIKQMHKLFRSLSLNTLLPASQQQINAELNELEMLSTAFKQMCLRLELSLEETLLSRSKEIQARMAALQSQMNPHFLYNTITVISVMAEEAGHHEIVRTCKLLSKMLRYILDHDKPATTIGMELDYTIDYLQLMQIRYEGMLYYEIDIHPDMRHIVIPAMTVQPIVENFFKHGLHVPPPWRISILGQMDDTRWSIQIADNGTGFSPEMIEKFPEWATRIDQERDFQRNPSKGIGMVNIDERLRMVYGNGAEFRISNNREGGAHISLGGHVKPASNLEVAPLYGTR
ncbi:cache domain-containing sensor histidine kinase [Paenibacillus piri]|uniref:Sensor histidine kinase n=1 Tax=Paenibacillus piri TaxID=2547395 RepID=A0A4R5KI95_9BACL|nr:sensor histidine kinase [Paenibacillus piri]TDF95106.1 sensor histidine kinase [Paenibacillus piri]